MGLWKREIKYIHNRICSNDGSDEAPEKLRELVNQCSGNHFYERIASMSSHGLQTYLEKYYIPRYFPDLQPKNPCAEIPLGVQGGVKK